VPLQLFQGCWGVYKHCVWGVAVGWLRNSSVGVSGAEAPSTCLSCCPLWPLDLAVIFFPARSGVPVRSEIQLAEKPLNGGWIKVVRATCSVSIGISRSVTMRERSRLRKALRFRPSSLLRTVAFKLLQGRRYYPGCHRFADRAAAVFRQCSHRQEYYRMSPVRL